MRIAYKERTYDYVDRDEMTSHIGKMMERGWVMSSYNEIEGDSTYKYTATFKTGILYNGRNGK